MSFPFLFYSVWEILACNTCPPPNPPMSLGDLIPPQNWLELHPYVGWAIVAAAVVMIPIIVKRLRE
ncbi:MAG: hypothetical protein KGI19_10465 [Thaumarchaeota archaeon]|nr:hypothetical protein [Nitrososphaerota archaeon]MDE1819010.1 hypothetical protein [Nitrososphaerota archaeon]